MKRGEKLLTIGTKNKPMEKQIDETKNKCDNCGKLSVKIRQFSPDSAPYYFCDEPCYHEYQKEHLYRALPAVWIATGKELRFGITEENAVCRGCGAKMKWIHLLSGKDMPVDPTEITIITADGRTSRGYIPHWATCPKADQFKKIGKNEK